jgi:hypothetical protein
MAPWRDLGIGRKNFSPMIVSHIEKRCATLDRRG